MKVIIALVLSLLVSMPALSAESKFFQWSYPVTRINGDSLPLSQLVSNQIDCGTVAGGPYNAHNFSVVDPKVIGGRTFLTPEIFTAGTYYCVIGTTTQNPDDPGVLPDLGPAAFSTEISFTVVACTQATCGANAPTNFGVT